MFLKESSNFNWKCAVILYFEILGSGKKDYHLIRLWSLGSITCLYCTNSLVRMDVLLFLDERYI